VIVSGKVWTGFISQKMEDAVLADRTGRSWELGGKIAVSDFTLLGYYYDGKNIDSNVALGGIGGLAFTNFGLKSDDDGGYVQGTFKLPGIGTKLGLSYGVSNNDISGGPELKNKSWIVGAYHPLTKSLNLVAEYTDQELDLSNAKDLDARTISLGAIMFF